MEARGDCVLSMATARPGVLVSAPATRPTMLGVSMPQAYFRPTAVSAAEPTMSNVSRISVLPLLRNESKKPGPAWMPMVKMNNTRPKLPNSLGMTTPKCPKSNAMNITAETSSDKPLIFIRPSMKPKATMRNRAKYEEFNKSVSIS